MRTSTRRHGPTAKPSETSAFLFLHGERKETRTAECLYKYYGTVGSNKDNINNNKRKEPSRTPVLSALGSAVRVLTLSL